MALDLDATDRRILTVLQKNGRITNAELSEAINLSPSACHRRVQRLEEDLRAAAAARDSFRLKLTQAEERQTALQRQLAAATVERDGLKAEVKARATERDALQAYYDTFRKNIKDLIGQAESSIRTPPPPTVLVGTAGN